MRLRLLTNLSLALLAGLSVRAQTAGNFFNSGAQFYISNNIPAALEKTENGLKLYPDDAKLKKLEELLKQQQQQQSQQNQQQKNNQSQQNKNQQSQQNQSQQQPQNGQQNRTRQEQRKNQAQKQSEQQKQEQQQAAEKQSEQKAPNQMTPHEAQRLLDSQKENEQFLQLKPNVPPQSKQPVEDW